MWSRHFFAQARFATSGSKAKTHYQILELSPTASMASIRKNYIRLAKIYHPDVYKGKDKNRFEKINEAYQILSDKAKRRKYDEQKGINQPVNEQEPSQSPFQPEQGKKRHKMKYDDPNAEELNIDEEYNKFFGEKPNTNFEEIRLAEDPEFRQMSESQRLRRHFANFYQADEALSKTQYQKDFSTIMDDHIQQKNRIFEQQVEAAKKMEENHSEKGIKKLKWRVYLISVVIFATTIPLLNSILTKYRLEREEREKVQEQMKEIDKDLQELQIRSRLKF